jgi:hemoglobin
MTTITPYDFIGGEQTNLSLVDRFYFFIGIIWPGAQGISFMHQPNLALAKAQVFKFLSG